MEALRRYDILDTPAEVAFERITALAARLFAAPIALISLVEDDRQWFKSCVGLSVSETGRDVSFCAHAIADDGSEGRLDDGSPHGGLPSNGLPRDSVFVVPDAALDPRFSDTGLVIGAPYIRFYAGAPLVTGDGYKLGTLCIIDTRPRAGLSAPEKATLSDLAALVIDEFELRLALKQAREETEERKKAEEALRESEERLERQRVFFENVLNFIPVEIVALSPEGRYLYCNPTAIKDPEIRHWIIGQNDEAYCRHRGLDAAIAAKRRERFELAVERRGEVSWEESLSTPQGEPRRHLRNLSPIFGEDGLELVIGFGLDITSRKLAEEALERAVLESQAASLALEGAKREAERANRAKSVFLSRMSHELRTPLNAILGFAQLLEMDVLDDEGRESVGHIVKAGRHLLALIDEVLNIASIEAGRLTLSIEPFNVGEVVDEAAALIRPLAARRGLTLELSACEAQVVADRQRFKQVLINLLSNAVKYNREGGRVTLACRREAGRLHVEVGDTGWGIAADKLGKLFTPFDRLGAEKSGVEGTGLGLALSKQLAQAMGGQIEVRSVPGEGSVFGIVLPVAPSALPAPSEAALTVLYIEDDLVNLRLVERALAQRPGVRFLSATRAAVGLDLTREHRPDLVLLDLHLPDLSGRETLERLRRLPDTQGMLVVVLSADATAASVGELRAAGADGYLSKPVDLRDLLATVDRARLKAAA